MVPDNESPSLGHVQETSLLQTIRDAILQWACWLRQVFRGQTKRPVSASDLAGSARAETGPQVPLPVMLYLYFGGQKELLG